MNLSTALSEHSLTADKFLYFFMGLRKGEIRRRVAALKANHPDEDPDKLAHRLINAQSALSVAGGALLHIPVFLPGVGPALKLMGVAGAGAVLMRMHMSLILEIGLLYGHDLDEPERLKELAAIIVASGLVACTPYLSRAMNLNSYSALTMGGLTVSTASQLIGLTAMRYYRKRTVLEAAPHPA